MSQVERVEVLKSKFYSRFLNPLFALFVLFYLPGYSFSNFSSHEKHSPQEIVISSLQNESDAYLSEAEFNSERDLVFIEDILFIIPDPVYFGSYLFSFDFLIKKLKIPFKLLSIPPPYPA